MNPKTLNILLKHAGWFSRKPKWETDPNWKDDPTTVGKWIGEGGWQNDYTWQSGGPEGGLRMDPEDFYALLNRYKVGYSDPEDEEGKRKRDNIKQILELLKKKQKSGIGPETYTYWMNREPDWAENEIHEYMSGTGVTPRPNIFNDDMPYDAILKLLKKQNFDPEEKNRAILENIINNVK